MRTKILVVTLLVMGFVMAACSAPQAQADTSQNAPQQDSGQNAQAAPQNGAKNGAPGAGRNTLESRLAMGTLKLEGSNQAVTASEAKTLLPLWQQVKTLSANTATAPADLQTAYTAIEKAMTADQIQAIQNMNLTQTDIQDLIKTLGITPPAGGPGGNGGTFPTMSADQRATRQAQRTLTPGSGGPGGAGGGTRGGFGFNRVFVDPLITLLQQRAGG